jgi:hypothetical protein
VSLDEKARSGDESQERGERQLDVKAIIVVDRLSKRRT